MAPTPAPHYNLAFQMVLAITNIVHRPYNSLNTILHRSRSIMFADCRVLNLEPLQHRCGFLRTAYPFTIVSRMAKIMINTTNAHLRTINAHVRLSTHGTPHAPRVHHAECANSYLKGNQPSEIITFGLVLLFKRSMDLPLFIAVRLPTHNRRAPGSLAAFPTLLASARRVSASVWRVCCVSIIKSTRD